MVVPVGHALGELSLLIDGPASVVYRCVTRSRFAALPREAVGKLLELQPRLYCLRLLHLAAARCAPWLHRVDAALDWLHVEGGRCLFREGDPMLGFFVVLSGRLLALAEHDDAYLASSRSFGPDSSSPHSTKTMPRGAKPNKWKVVDVFHRGRLCGELDCLRNRPYSGTVRASRDTEVCQISPSLLHLIANEFPKAILKFSTLVGPQALPKHVGPAQSLLDKVTITVVPTSAEVKVKDICASLTRALSKMGKTLHIGPNSDLTAAWPRSKSQSGSRSLDGPRLARYLADLEERCRWVIYEAEPGWTDWTRRCVRQADHILIAANFDGSGRDDVLPTRLEQLVEDAAPLYVDRDLLLLHERPGSSPSRHGSLLGSLNDEWIQSADALRPGVGSFVRHQAQLFLSHAVSSAKRSTRHYLNKRPWIKRWHHVRPEELGDWARCARLLTGCAVGLCLGGGGARGNVHFGVVQALEELGIPIDVVSGTSFGALAGAMYCSTAPRRGSLMKVVTKVMGTHFSVRNMLFDFNFPRTSYFTGYYLNNVLQNAFGRRRCEDLLIPFACTSCDIANFESKIHTEGSLWRIIRASMSLVGFVPPLPFQERRVEDGKMVHSLLVDGGYVNQYPTEALREHGAGIIITIVCCPEHQPIATDYGEVVRGGLVTLRRTFGWACGCSRRAGLDPPSQDEIQERLMFLVETMKESHKLRSDLVISPPIDAYGLLDFAKYKELVKVGYDASASELNAWLAGEAKAAQQVRQLIDITKADERVSNSINEVEYGTRRGYGVWRQVQARTRKVLRRRSADGDAVPGGAPDIPTFVRKQTF